MTIELGHLGREELKVLQKKLEGEFKKRQSSMVKDAREELRAVEQKYGMSIEQILAGKKSEDHLQHKASLEPKYRHPENADQVWSGRGKKPKWFTEAIQAGKTEEELSV